MKKTMLIIVVFLFMTEARSHTLNFDSAQNLNEKLHDTTHVAELINRALHHEKDRTKTVEMLENTLLIIEKATTKKHSEAVQQKLTLQLAITNSEIGRIFIELSHIKLAVPYLFEALKHYEVIKDKEGIAKTTMNIGLAFNDQKNYRKSKEYFDKATKICLEINDLKTLGKVYNNYSVSLYDQNKKQESTAYVYKALEVFKKINDKQGISYCLYNIAQKYNDAGNPQEAMPYLMQSLDIRREIDDTRAIAESLNAIGICYRWMNDVPSSLEYLKQANALARENGFFHVLESSSNMLNYIYEEDLKDAENALKTYKVYIEARDTIQNEKAKTDLLEKHYQYEYETKKALIREETEAEKQKQKIIFMAIIGVLCLILIFTLVGFYFYKKKKAQERELEEKELLIKTSEAERRRIAADLHDDLGVGISTISLLGNRIKKQEKIADIKTDAENIIENTKKVSEKLTEVIWELNAEHNNLEHLLLFIQKQGQHCFKETATDFSMVIPLEIPDIFLSSYQRKQIYLSIKESFNNIIKHASASHVHCRIMFNGTLIIAISDDGNGFDVNEKMNSATGEGLKNIKSRLESINGKVNIQSSFEGTITNIEISIQKQ